MMPRLPNFFQGKKEGQQQLPLKDGCHEHQAKHQPFLSHWQHELSKLAWLAVVPVASCLVTTPPPTTRFVYIIATTRPSIDDMIVDCLYKRMIKIVLSVVSCNLSLCMVAAWRGAWCSRRRLPIGLTVKRGIWNEHWLSKIIRWDHTQGSSSQRNSWSLFVTLMKTELSHEPGLALWCVWSRLTDRPTDSQPNSSVLIDHGTL